MAYTYVLGSTAYGPGPKSAEPPKAHGGTTGRASSEEFVSLSAADMALRDG